MNFRYRLIAVLLSPWFFLHTLRQALQGGGKRYFLQRLGLRHHGDSNADTLWVHCASVGEVQTALPLIYELKRHHAALQVLISTNTPTAAQVVQQQSTSIIKHAYLPLDWKGAVKRFLRAHRPSVGLIVETEIWPRLFFECSKKNIPILIINARLSARTSSIPGFFKPIYTQALAHCSQILARSQRDANAFIQLGAISGRVSSVGNLKFAGTAFQPERPVDIGIEKIFLAASTHDDEELQLAYAWRKLNNNQPLFIAPRHPSRVERISQVLRNQGFIVQRRTEQTVFLENTQIYIIDTVGELAGLMHFAEVIFIGGSLVPRGGHNVLEASRLGKFCLTGPFTEQIDDELQLLCEAGAALRLSTADAVAKRANELLGNHQVRQQAATAAIQVTQNLAKVLEDYHQHIATYLANSKNT